MEISGSDLIETGKKQAEKFGAEIVAENVETIEKQAEELVFKTDKGSYETKHVILATGVLTDLADKVGLKTKDGTEPRIKTIFDVDALGKTNVDGNLGCGYSCRCQRTYDHH